MKTTMKPTGYLIILISISFLLLLVYITADQHVSGAGEWAGGDDLLQNQIGGITGGEYKPWFEPLWKPPSGEIETFLFSLQAAIGAIIMGYYIGYYKGKKEVSEK
jgi:cobalt/nickel transport protein